jgi:hypothetical protein
MSARHRCTRADGSGELRSVKSGTSTAAATTIAKVPSSTLWAISRDSTRNACPMKMFYPRQYLPRNHILPLPAS